MRYSEFKLLEGVFSPIVKQMQRYLISKGYDLGPTKDDGIMGPYTKAAVDKYLSGQSPGSAPAPRTNTQPRSPTTSSGEIMPTKGTITGHYGRTVTGPKGNKVKHPGVDIGAPTGTPVIAPDDGKIQFAGMAGSAGNLVELITASGVKHRFMHLSKISVRQGDEGKKGQTVGAVGSTGFSSGPHLHWEKYASGQQVNPIAE